MSPENHVTGLFTSDQKAAATIRSLKDTPFKIKRVHGPIPSHHILEALAQKKSRVGWYTLCGGITGFFSGFLLAIFCATQWNLIVSGKPVIALIPFVIVGFEFTILFAVFGNVIGLLTETGLPRFEDLKTHDPRYTGEHFGVVAACDTGQRENLISFFKDQGAEVATVEAQG